MNSDTTSKGTRSSSLGRTCGLMNSVKALEFRTCAGELPTRGARIAARCFDSW